MEEKLGLQGSSGFGYFLCCFVLTPMLPIFVAILRTTPIINGFEKSSLSFCHYFGR